MKRGQLGVIGAVCALMTAAAPVAAADPPTVSAEPAQVDPAGAAPVDHAAYALPADGRIESAPPATSVSPDGWTLTVGAKDEVMRNVNPLTTAVSSRDYDVSAVFTASLRGPEGAEPPRGVLEVGYQIGCGIDMSTSNGVTITGTAGVTPSIGLLGIDADSVPIDGITPVLSTPFVGGLAIGLKPGIVNIVPVAKKRFTGADPWVSVSGFRVKIDGCGGESFIRSYAVLTLSGAQSDSIQGYYGTTRKV